MSGRLTLEDQIGVADNLDEQQPPWNKPSVMIGMTIAFGVLTSTALCIRLYVRLKIIKAPGWDDLLIFMIMLTGAVGTVCVCMSPYLGGMGRHIVELTMQERKTYFKLFYVADGIFVTSVGLIKMSLILQYLRIFTTGPHRYVCLASLTLVASWAAVTCFMVWFPCFPVRGYWDWDIEGRKCYGYGSMYVEDHYATFLAHSVVNMCLDLLILALPLPLLFRPNTVHRTKLGLGGLLVVGAIANVLAALRLAETVRHRAMSHPTFDHTWYSPTLCILGMLEVSFCCIGASVPVFWPIVRDKLDAIFVTREINISVAERNIENLHGQRSESLYSHDGSEGRRLWEENPPVPSKGDHYKDTYVMDHVDPLRKKSSMAAVVTTTVTRDTNQTRLSQSKDS